MLPNDPTISLCMIVKNEQEFLPVCLDSVRDLVSEIIVADTGSSDRTIDIAASYGAAVFSIPWRNDFAQARNESLKHATSDWILYLDADERIDERNKNKIRKLIQLQDIWAINVRVIIPQSQRNLVTNFSNDYSRIFRNLPQIRFEGKVHEQILPSINRMGGKVLKSDIVFDHWGYALKQDKRKFRIQQNLVILTEELQKNPDDPFVHYNLGDTYRFLGNTDLAISHFERILELDHQDLKVKLLSNVYIFLAQLYLSKQNYFEAETYTAKAIQLTPDEPLPYYIMATLYFERGDLIACQRKLDFILQLINSPAHCPSSEINVFQVQLDLGNCYYKQQNYRKAQACYLQAVNDDPLSLEGCFNLAKCFMKLKDYSAASRWLEKVLQIHPGFEPARQSLMECYEL